MTLPEVETIVCPGPIESRPGEQLRFKLTGRWSDRVVDERMAEVARVERINRQRFSEWLVERAWK